MIKPVLFCPVFLFTAAQFAASDRISIVTSPDRPCPGERNGLFCLTLQQFVSSGIISRIENLTLELEPGVHVLESRLYVSGRRNLEITGDNTTIVCTNAIPHYDSFYVQSPQNFSITGITFVNCSRVYFYSISRVVISGINFHGLFSTGLELRSIYIAASVHSCSFVGKNIGIYLYRPPANTSIDSCTFNSNYQSIYLYQLSTNISIDSCTFIDNYQSVYLYRPSANISIDSCNFIGNRQSIYLQRWSANISIDSCTFVGNCQSIYLDNDYYYYGYYY